MSAAHLRRKFNSQFRSYSKNSISWAWGIFSWNVALMVSLVGAGAEVLAWPWAWTNILLTVAIIIAIGTRFRALNNIVHECSHALFCVDRSTNDTIGKCCALIILSSFKDYRDEHLSHHAHLGDPELDKDLGSIRALRLDEPLSKGSLLRHMVTPLIGRHLSLYLSVSTSDGDGRGWKLGRYALVAAAMGAFLVWPVPVGLFVITPYVFVYTALNYWADCFDHAGIVPTKDDLYGSRNMLVPQPIRAIFFPLNDSFHLVHHLFPQVPAQHLSSAHEMLTTDPTYLQSPNAVSRKVSLQMSGERQYSDPRLG